METIRIETEKSCAEIRLAGGELTQWRCNQADLLWTPDPAYWRRTSPVLFPVVGWLNNNGIFIHGRRRPMTVHGFAKTAIFNVLEQSKAHATIELTPSAETADLYPFEFRLRIRYSIFHAALHIDATLFNDGSDAMPYGLGIYPGFRWPLPGAEGRPHALTFSSLEHNRVPVVDPDGYICRELRQIPFDGKTLLLEASLFENDVLCFLNAASAFVTFSDGHSAITVSSNNFPHWGIWSKPGAGFLCIQSWTSYGDAPGFAGSIFEKPSMILLPPGASRRHTMTWEYQEPAWERYAHPLHAHASLRSKKRSPGR